MIEPLRITDPAQLDVIESALGDQTLDLAGLQHDSGTGTLEIPILLDGDEVELVAKRWFRRTWRVRLVRGVLRVRHVSKVHVDDRGQIELFTFLRLKWARENSTLSIVAFEDMEIHAHVTGIEVELCGSDEIIGHRDFTEYFRFIYWYGPSVLHSQ